MTDTATPTPPARWTWRTRIGLAFGAALVVFLLVLLGFRGLGTGTYEGTVVRAYEKMDDYRIEIQDREGDIHVFTNREMRWPYFKTDTADLQAEFERFHQQGDLVAVDAYGFRVSLFSWFPNALSITSLLTAEEIRTRRARAWAPAIVSKLRADDLVAEDADPTALEDLVVEALVEAQETKAPLAP